MHEWVERLEAWPWTLIAVGVIAIGGLLAVWRTGFMWGDYFAALGTIIALHGVGHRIKSHTAAVTKGR